MSHYVTEACIKCKFTDCVSVCPVDCFYEGPNMLVINPDECIDCGVCIPECPVEAIVSEHDMNKLDDKSWIEINTRMSRVWPNIVDKLDPPIDAENWAKVKEKKHLIEE